MKKSSVLVKLTLWFLASLVLSLAAGFLIVRFASQTVLRSTVRDYLIAAVEENVSKIRYTEETEDPSQGTQDQSVLRIPFGNGTLSVDADFLDVVNDVHAALFTADGKLLYGEDPLGKAGSSVSFTESGLREVRSGSARYTVYDRRVILGAEVSEGLYIRGAVSDQKSVGQLREITRLSLFLLPLLTLIVLFFSYLLIRRLLSPLKRIEEAADRISKGSDLDERIPEGKKEDEIGRLARAFNRMLDRLKHSFENERRFTSDASHELRTPTSVILAETEFVLEKERTREDEKEALRVIDRQAKRMQGLIGDMLDYTRMDQDPSRYPFETTDFSAIVRENADPRLYASDKEISLQAEIQDGVRIQGSETLLTRMLQNLIQNAFRYGKEGGRVDVRLKKEEGRVILQVADDGIGIAKEEQEKIFERFYRSDSSRRIPGTGLGLSMVKRIAELHGGSIAVESAPDEGSCFTVTLPSENAF